MTEMVSIRFIEATFVYAGGETVRIPAEKAMKYVASGMAVVVPHYVVKVDSARMGVQSKFGGNENG